MKTLKYILRTLFSNKGIIDEGKKQKWWLCIILFIVSIVLSILPTIITSANTQGSSIITANYAQNIDYSLEKFSIDYLNGNEAPLSMKIKDGKLSFDEGKSFSDLKDKKSLKLLNEQDTFEYIEIKKENDNNPAITTMIIGYTSYSDAQKSTYSSSSEKLSYIATNLTPLFKTNEEANENGYFESCLPQLLVFFDSELQMMLFENNNKIEYKMENDKVVINGKINNKSYYQGLYNGITSPASQNFNNFYNEENKPAIIEKWKSMLNQAFEPLKNSTILQATYMYGALNSLIILFLGFLVFLMSRMKSAACEKMNLLEGLKLSTLMALSPALISFILSFVLQGSIVSMIFIMGVSLRAVFLTTKMTRGDVPAPVKK